MRRPLIILERSGFGLTFSRALAIAAHHGAITLRSALKSTLRAGLGATLRSKRWAILLLLRAVEFRAGLSLREPGASLWFNAGTTRGRASLLLPLLRSLLWPPLAGAVRVLRPALRSALRFTLHARLRATLRTALRPPFIAAILWACLTGSALFHVAALARVVLPGTTLRRALRTLAGTTTGGRALKVGDILILLLIHRPGRRLLRRLRPGPDGNGGEG